MSKQIQRANKLAKQSQLTVKTISTTIAKRYTNNPWAIHTSSRSAQRTPKNGAYKSTDKDPTLQSAHIITPLIKEQIHTTNANKGQAPVKRNIIAPSTPTRCRGNSNRKVATTYNKNQDRGAYITQVNSYHKTHNSKWPQRKQNNISHKGSDNYTQSFYKSNTTAKTLRHSSEVFPSSIPIKEDAGKLGLMWPRGALANSHPAAAMLNSYSSKGCPVDTGKNWEPEMILKALRRGPHISAKNPEASKYLMEETKEKLQGGYISIKKWGNIKHSYPKNLKLSPLAMIPHKSRSYRCILDLSFELKVNGNKITSVNQGTNILSPQKAMAQLGWVIRRIITTMANNFNPQQPFLFSKCDIKDGFWRLSVNHKDAWNFCYVLPSASTSTTLDDIDIVVPHALQMGWSESPPFFCAATETARDVIQQYYDNFTNIPPHPLEAHLYNTTELRNDTSTNKTTSLIEVYVDDFIACTNNSNKAHIQHLSRAMLHGIHSIFPPPQVSGHQGEDPISNKKLLQHEGLFHTEKEILGWMLNGKDYTITLPSNKVVKITNDINKLLKSKVVPSNHLEKLQGKLIHASLGIPSGRGLMSPLYATYLQAKEFTTMTEPIKQCLKDWKELLKQVADRKTSVLELVPADPHYIGYVDSSKSAAGGIWTNGCKQLKQQWVWRLEWPKEIQDSLVSSKNKSGTISINDLEMASILMGWLILEQITPSTLQGAHIGMFCDNMSTVSWTKKKSTSTSTLAGHLLRALALRQLVNRTSPLTTVHIEGKLNNMADDASRSFNDPQFSKSNTSFIQTFNTLYPLQNDSWQEYKVPKRLASRVISCLLGKPLAMASWVKITVQGINTGTTGQTTQEHSGKANSSMTAPSKSRSSSSQHLLQGSGQASSAKDVLSELRQSHKHWLPFPRPLNWLENYPQSTKQKKLTKHQWHGNWKGTEEKTRQQHHN